MILCDPPVKKIRFGREHNRILEKVKRNLPFQGGYADFMPYDERGKITFHGPSRDCMLEDICFYYQQCGDILGPPDNPMSATVFLKKIVASHYLQLIDFVRAILSDSQWPLSRKNNLGGIDASSVEEQWSTLQAHTRRCSEYIEDVQAILLSLKFEVDDSIPRPPKNWMDCETDFRYIHKRLLKLKNRADALVDSTTGLAGIVGNKQALKEAERSRALATIGLVFIPLAYTSALFSMSGQYSPGADYFWLYFAVSIPLMVVVFLSRRLSECLDGNANWFCEKAKGLGQW